MTGDLQSAPSTALCRSWLGRLQRQDAGGYVAHCQAADATLVPEDASSGAVLGALAVSAPLLVLSQRCLVVFSAGSNAEEIAMLPLAGETSCIDAHPSCTGNFPESCGLMSV